MDGKQGIHSENCISWRAGSHADLVLDCGDGKAERMPGSAMLNPAPGGPRGTVHVPGHKGHFSPPSQALSRLGAEAENNLASCSR